MEEEENIQLIINLYGENNWQKILELSTKSKFPISTKLSWIWPSIENLQFMHEVLQQMQLNGLTSIGCGTGLLEWLFHKFTNYPVIGYEVNKEWWTSRYSMQQFIKVKFLAMPPSSDHLPNDNALLFCYFNNGPAFQDYINVYKGNSVIIIGPGIGRGTHTNPDPFKPNLDKSWKLFKHQYIGDTKDVIAVYTKC